MTTSEIAALVCLAICVVVIAYRIGFVNGEQSHEAKRRLVKEFHEIARMYLDRRFPPAPIYPDDPPLTDPEAEVTAWCEANSGNFAPEMLHHVRWAWRVLADLEPADDEQKARAVALLTRHKAPMP